MFGPKMAPKMCLARSSFFLTNSFFVSSIDSLEVMKLADGDHSDGEEDVAAGDAWSDNA